MRPVLLLHVRVVVLAAGTLTGELHLPFGPAQVFPQRPVEELAAIVGMEAFHFERQLAFDVFELRGDAPRALVPSGTDLRPTRAHIGETEAVIKIPRDRAATVRPRYSCLESKLILGGLVTMIMTQRMVPPFGKTLPRYPFP